MPKRESTYSELLQKAITTRVNSKQLLIHVEQASAETISSSQTHSDGPTIFTVRNETALSRLVIEAYQECNLLHVRRSFGWGH